MCLWILAKIIKLLDLGSPKLVIRLLPSYGVYSQMKLSHSEVLGTFEEIDGATSVTVDLDTAEEFTDYMSEAFPNALKALKAFCEV